MFALAIGQIGSAYPTAGGLYHWGSILGNRGTGWVTAWLNLLGLITVLGAINVGTWTFFFGAFGADARHRRARDRPARRSSSIVITGTPGADQPSRHRLTTLLTDFSGYLIFGVASVLIAVVCLVAAPNWDLSPAVDLHQLFR